MFNKIKILFYSISTAQIELAQTLVRGIPGVESQSVHAGEDIKKILPGVDVLVSLGPEPYDNDSVGLPVVHLQSVEHMDSSTLIHKVKTALCGSMPQAQWCEDSDQILPAPTQWEIILKKVELVKNHEAAILILGETGVGKDLLARSIHKASQRASRPFVPLNCGSIPLSLVESELWGCEKGAFTDAISRPGLFEQAKGGTIFMDEVGELPLDVQVKLLRVLDEKRLKRVGGKTFIDVDFRLISATNLNLTREVEAGRFRKDLFYRLHVLTLNVPPLRQRQNEIYGLVHLFLPDTGPGIASCALNKLLKHPWPGNIRELKSVIDRALILCLGKIIQAEHIQFDGLLNLTNSQSLEN